MILILLQNKSAPHSDMKHGCCKCESQWCGGEVRREETGRVGGAGVGATCRGRGGARARRLTGDCRLGRAARARGAGPGAGRRPGAHALGLRC